MSKKKKQVRKQQSATATKPATAKWYANSTILAGLLFAFACLLYANTLSHGYALDDAIVITQNVVTQKGPSAWGELFAHDTFYGFFQDDAKAKLVSGGRYRPLSLALFSLEAAISDGPFLHHLLNVIWYGGLVVLLYVLLLKIQGHRRAEAPAYGLPLVAALVFAAHPLHTEVVANIKGRDEIMALAGSLAALWFVWKAVDKQSWLAATLAGGCFFLGLLSKETTITFLAVIPLALYALRRDFNWGLLKYLAPTLAMAAVFLLIRASVLGTDSGPPIRELMNNPFLKFSNGQWVELSFAEWSATVVYGLGKYLQLLLAPLQLSHDYYPRAYEIMDWGNWRVILSLLANAGLFVFGLFQLRKRPWIAVGVLAYFLTLSIVSNVFFPVGTLLSERFLFFPSVGFALVAGWLFTAGFRRDSLELRSSKVAYFNSKVLGGVLGALLLFYTYKTIDRNGVWQDNYTLFTTDVHHQPGSAKLQNAAAGSKVDRYISLPESRKAANQNLLTEAIAHLDRAVQIHPTYKNAFAIRGTAHLLAKNHDAAIADFSYALELDPDYEDAADKLLLSYREAGRYYGETKGDLNRSQAYLQKALQLDPKDYESLRLTGVLNGVSGRKQEAIKFFRLATEADPNNADGWWNLGVAYFQNGQTELAEQQFARARQLDPGIDARKQNGG